MHTVAVTYLLTYLLYLLPLLPWADKVLWCSALCCVCVCVSAEPQLRAALVLAAKVMRCIQCSLVYKLQHFVHKMQRTLKSCHFVLKFIKIFTARERGCLKVLCLHLAGWMLVNYGKVAEAGQRPAASWLVQQRKLHQSAAEWLAASRWAVVTECWHLLRRQSEFWMLSGCVFFTTRVTCPKLPGLCPVTIRKRMANPVEVVATPITEILHCF